MFPTLEQVREMQRLIDSGVMVMRYSHFARKDGSKAKPKVQPLSHDRVLEFRRYMNALVTNGQPKPVRLEDKCSR